MHPAQLPWAQDLRGREKPPSGACESRGPEGLSQGWGRVAALANSRQSGVAASGLFGLGCRGWLRAEISRGGEGSWCSIRARGKSQEQEEASLRRDSIWPPEKFTTPP